MRDEVYVLVLVIGFAAGLLVAAPPVGPLTTLFYRRLVVQQTGAALALAIVAAVGDGLYAGLVAFGYESLVAAHSAVALGVRIVGVVVLAVMGIHYTFFPPDVEEALEDGQNGTDPKLLRKVTLQAAALSALNPSALVTWIIVLDFVRAAIHSEALAPWQQWAMPVSVALGTFTWFGGVVAAWSRWVERPPVAVARVAMRVIGLVLLGTSVWYAWKGIEQLQEVPADAFVEAAPALHQVD